jgi:hypothetical protein
MKDKNGHKKHMNIVKENMLPILSYDEKVSINLKTYLKPIDKAYDIAATSTVFGGLQLPPNVIELALSFDPLIYHFTDDARKNAKLITNYFGNLLLSPVLEQTFLPLSSYADEYKIIQHQHKKNDLSLLFPTVNANENKDAEEKKKVEIGQLDFLDGMICKLARLLGVDTIVLQHEVGSFDAVTEVLDARENSVDHLCSLNVINTTYSSATNSEEFPKIWFLQNGVVLSQETDEAGIVGVHRPVKINIKTGEMLIKSTETKEFQHQPGFYNY